MKPKFFNSELKLTTTSMKKCISKILNLQGMLIGKVEVLDEEKKIVVACRNASRTALEPLLPE
jgi:hypothetical protein